MNVFVCVCAYCAYHSTKCSRARTHADKVCLRWHIQSMKHPYFFFFSATRQTHPRRVHLLMHTAHTRRQTEEHATLKYPTRYMTVCLNAGTRTLLVRAFCVYIPTWSREVPLPNGTTSAAATLSVGLSWRHNQHGAPPATPPTSSGHPRMKAIGGEGRGHRAHGKHKLAVPTQMRMGRVSRALFPP